MKSVRFMLGVVLIALSTGAFAQSDAQKSFDKLKTLAGTWVGHVKIDPPTPEMEKDPVRVVLRITSRGNALVHEMADANSPDDPTKFDHPVTMFYVDSDRLTLVHYCDAGNRPRMSGKLSSDGKQVDFSFVDLSGADGHGHMEHALFTAIDNDHHAEDWTFVMPGDKVMHAHMDLTRTN